MEEKRKSFGIGLLLGLILGLIVVAITVGIFVIKYKAKDDLKPESQINNIERKQEISTLENVDIVEENINEESKEDILNGEIDYEITILDETSAKIEAIRDGEVVSSFDFTGRKDYGPTGEFERDVVVANIDKYDVVEIESVGKVALISETAGEYYGINVFKLVNDKIQKLGNINVGTSLFVDGTEYKVNFEDESQVEITATRRSDSLTRSKKLILVSTEVDSYLNVEVVNWLDGIELVLVTEKSFDEIKIKAYALCALEGFEKNAAVEEIGSLSGMF